MSAPEREPDTLSVQQNLCKMSNFPSTLVSSPAVGLKESSLKSFSCLVCRQRKVKCNRIDPCSGCVRAGVPCKFMAPTPSRRKRRKPVKEGLHARLQRYERILKSYGARIEASGSQSASEDSAGEDEFRATEHVRPQRIKSENHEKSNSNRAQLVSQKGKSRYFDSEFWTTLTEEINDPTELFSDASEDPSESFASVSRALDGNALLLGLASNQGLALLHPPKAQLEKLWELFKENVDPPTKLVHVPSLQKTIDALCNAHYQLPKSQEALMFSIYLSAVGSLSEEECMELFGEHKDSLFSTYRLSTQQALVNAAYLKSSNLVTLQAYMFLISSLRTLYDTSTLMCYSGVAVRIARRMGLHRDGLSLGLPPFDTEMRRRLWWFVVNADCRLAELCGSSSQDLQGDTKPPLNLNDSDLSPGMTEPLKDRQGITDMVFVFTKCHILNGLKTVDSGLTSDTLRSSPICIAAKEEIIEKLEDSLEQRVLRYCDPLNPLHLLSSILCRAAVCKLRVNMYKPSIYAQKGKPMPQSAKDTVFENGVKIIEYGIMMHTTPALQRYRWSIGPSFLWDSVIYTLVEVRNRKASPEIDRVWLKIEELFKHYPQVLNEAGNPLYNAVGIWTVKVWEECTTARGLVTKKEYPTPDFITQFRRNKFKPISTTPDFLSSMPTGLEPFGYEQVDSQGQPADSAEQLSIPSEDSQYMQDALYFPPESVDWMQLDYFLRGTQ